MDDFGNDLYATYHEGFDNSHYDAWLVWQVEGLTHDGYIVDRFYGEVV